VQIGVVVAVRGFSPYLVQTLDAVLGQTLPATDVVLVDDGSRLPVVLRPEHAARVRVLRLDRPTGPGAARNAGIAALRDEVDHVAFCDHDDVWGAGHLAAHARAGARHPSAAILSGDTEIIGADDRPTGEAWRSLHHGLHRSDLVLPLIYELHPLCTSATVVRRAELEAVGGFDESLPQAEDLDLWLRLLESGSDLVSVLGATVRYRRHAAGLTHDVGTLAEALHRVHVAHADHVPDRVVRRAGAGHLRALATALARAGDYGGALEAMERAADQLPPTPVERVKTVLLRLPALRGCIGRRAPYPGR
jgi:GT2 family glycosyltransferase